MNTTESFEQVLELFSTPTRDWFISNFSQTLPSQNQGWPAIADGQHTLIQAPTGSGKTLAAFLWVIDRLANTPLPPTKQRCRVVYISPLKALAYDIERNLVAPLRGIKHAAERAGTSIAELTTFLRTGDTPQQQRQRMLRHPSDILITTPESLQLILTSQARQTLKSVKWVILDEIHAIAGNKRGAHLSLSLERLEQVTENPPQRIGLSATQKPIETTGRFLAGYSQTSSDRWEVRPHRIIDVSAPPQLDIELLVPVEDMTSPNLPPDSLTPPPTPRDDPDISPPPTGPITIWTAIYPPILELIRNHNSTIIFANNRRLTERICSELNSLAGEDIARAHHGSVARPQRVAIEEALKAGQLKAVVATSSLELGIHMGAVDLVIQVEAPISVTSGLQRVGRSEHHAEGVSRAKVFPKYRGDLLVATVLVDRMVAGQIETTTIPRQPLDVLCQQLVAEVAICEQVDLEDLYRMVCASAPYHQLSRSLFEACLDMLSGRYPSDLFSDLRPRLNWDRIEGTLTSRRGSRQLVVANPGTIPDRGMYRVVLADDGAHVGELDEEMVYESRVGDVFLLGTTSWRIVAITRDRVEVTPEPGTLPGTIPFWHGDMLGRSADTGAAIGAFIRELSNLDPDSRQSLLTDHYRLDHLAALNLSTYIGEELEAVGIAANDQQLVVQKFQDEIGDWRMVLLSPYGARVHAPWSMILTESFRQRYGYEVNGIWSDDGFAFRFPEADELPSVAELVPEPEEAEALLMEQVGETALFSARFREAAGRALLLPRRRPGSRTPLWLRRRRSAELLEIAKKFGSFPIVLETYREVLQDDFDLSRLQQILRRLQSREIGISEVEVSSPSPFASSLLFAFAAAYLYEGDAPLAERRAAALTLDRELLSELLDEGEIREIISPDVVTQVEAELQFLTSDRLARSADAVHDLLAKLGPLSTAGLEVRTQPEFRPKELGEWLDELVRTRRVVEMKVGGETRWVAIEDVGRLRDALGCQPPDGVPEVFLETVIDPLADVVGRYVRTHGPFGVTDLTNELGLPVGVVNATLSRLQEDSQVVSGTFSTGVTETEWVGTDVLRRIKRRSLAVLRREIEPVPTSALAQFLGGWQQIKTRPARGLAAMSEIVQQLQGFSVPASVLERDILSVRHAQVSVSLDQLLAAGEVVWVGTGSLGPRDGKLALYFRSQVPLLADLPQPEFDQPEHQQILDILDRLGAAFFAEIYQHVGGGEPDRWLEALWDLVWGGMITNDSLAPVRAYTGRRQRQSPKSRRHRLKMSFPPHSAGRWSLVQRLLTTSPIPEEKALAWSEQLLDRYGILTRSAVLAEGFPGGFSRLYPLLSRLEETGRVRRGYFVEGLGGAQFAVRGAVDRLRTENKTGVTVLAATDPANPYGSILAWPKLEQGRLARVAGSFVLMAEGELVGMIEGSSVRLWEEDHDRLEEVATEISVLAGRHKRFRLTKYNGQSITDSEIASHLTSSGFVPSPRGLSFQNRPSS